MLTEMDKAPREKERDAESHLEHCAAKTNACCVRGQPLAPATVLVLESLSDAP